MPLRLPNECDAGKDGVCVVRLSEVAQRQIPVSMCVRPLPAHEEYRNGPPASQFTRQLDAAAPITKMDVDQGQVRHGLLGEVQGAPDGGHRAQDRIAGLAECHLQRQGNEGFILDQQNYHR